MPTAYVTLPPDAAPDIARTLVGEGLAACVTRVDWSTYRPEGKVHEDEFLPAFASWRSEVTREADGD